MKILKNVVKFLALFIEIPVAVLVAAIMWVFVPYVLRKVS